MDEYAALTTEEQRLIAEHLALVLEANKTLNLTRIETVEDGMILHVEDSLAALDEVNAAPSGMLVEVGSGGGYPGIPLAIATKRDTLLVDARQKKVEALASIIEQLDLSRSISVFAGRAELLGGCRVAAEISEGKYHQVKRMFASLGYHVEALRRVRIGNLSLDAGSQPGDMRVLTAEEAAKVFVEAENR